MSVQNLGVLLTGPLEKRGSYQKSQWQERYFVLTSGGFVFLTLPQQPLLSQSIHRNLFPIGLILIPSLQNCF
jgi:hypothetical protein